MKVMKRSHVRNFIIDVDFYNDKEFEKLVRRTDVFTTYDANLEDMDIDWTESYYYRLGKAELRISRDSCKEVKVTYSKELDMYYNVVVTNEGQEIAIRL